MFFDCFYLFYNAWKQNKCQNNRNTESRKMKTGYFHFFLQYDLLMSLPENAQMNKMALPNGVEEICY